MRTSSSWARRTRAAMAVVVMPVIMLGMVAADAPLHAQEFPWTPSDSTLRLLAYAHHSGLAEPERMVIRSLDEWVAVWRHWRAWPPVSGNPPAVDFETEMVLIAALGTKPNLSSIAVIDSVTETTHEVVVHVRTTWLRPGCIASPAFTEPAVAVATPARAKPVRFVHRVQPANCD